MDCKFRKFLVLLAVAVSLLSYFLPNHVLAQDQITVTTWNIEHLGTGGRGFGGGFGAGNLPKRSSDELKAIASLIKDDLKSDILALQEIGITRTEEGISFSDQLDQIVGELGDG